MTASTTASVPLAAADEAALHAILARHIDAWNRHDMAALAADLAEDVVWINVVGMEWHGRRQVEAAHAALHRTMFAQSRLVPGPVALRALAPGVALAVSRTGIEGAGTTPDGRPYPARGGIMTLLFGKSGERWRIIHAHNTNIDAAAAAHDPAARAGTP